MLHRRRASVERFPTMYTSTIDKTLSDDFENYPATHQTRDFKKWSRALGKKTIYINALYFFSYKIVRFMLYVSAKKKKLIHISGY